MLVAMGINPCGANSQLKGDVQEDKEAANQAELQQCEALELAGYLSRRRSLCRAAQQPQCWGPRTGHLGRHYSF